MPTIDWKFIEPLEGFETAGYALVQDAGSRVPSGVTIGSGVDLGVFASIRVEDEPLEVGREVGVSVGVLGAASGGVGFADDGVFPGFDRADDEFAGALPVVTEEEAAARGGAHVVEAVAF